jgi:hypothetical protein
MKRQSLQARGEICTRVLQTRDTNGGEHIIEQEVPDGRSSRMSKPQFIVKWVCFPAPSLYPYQKTGNRRACLLLGDLIDPVVDVCISGSVSAISNDGFSHECGRETDHPRMGDQLAQSESLRQPCRRARILSGKSEVKSLSNIWKFPMETQVQPSRVSKSVTPALLHRIYSSSRALFSAACQTGPNCLEASTSAKQPKDRLQIILLTQSC